MVDKADKDSAKKMVQLKMAEDKLRERRKLALEDIDEKNSGILIGDKWTPFSKAGAKTHYKDLDRRAGIALSGGGIRSATISLGLCEALASRGRLYGFDMLSTVSGGGYFGSFFRSLHVERDDSDTEHIITSRQNLAKATMASMPDQQYFRGEPGSSKFVKAGNIIKNPLWWLRENGRYLAPKGGADYTFALAYIVRNWLAMMLFLTSVFFLAFAGLQFAMVAVQCLAEFTGQALVVTAATEATPSPLMILLAPGGIILAGIALAYWFSTGWPYFRPNSNEEETGSWLAKWAGVLISIGVVTGILCGWYYGLIPPDKGTQIWAIGLFGVFLTALLSAFGFAFLAWFLRRPAHHVDFRRSQTRLLGIASMCLVGIAVLALIDSAALWLRPIMRAAPVEAGQSELLATGSLSTVITSVLSILIARLPSMLEGKQSWFAGFARRNAVRVATLASMLILFAIAVFANTLAIKLLWNGAAWDEGGSIEWPLFAIIVTVVSLITVLLAKSRNFTNLLALTPLYGSRLTRTFVGGSNVARLLPGQKRASTRGQDDDDIPIKGYMESDCAAPFHLINVTRNRTVGELHGGKPIKEDHDDPLVLRSSSHPLGRLASYESNLTLHDRHGDRMVFGPFGMRVGGSFVNWKNIEEPPTLGHLCAISGAAVGAGMGRLSSLGTSMALTLANVRLGHWWPSQQSPNQEGEETSSFKFSAWLPGLACLLKELTGRFDTSNYWFLSDGGHSENTGVLTLLERGCEFILASDNGQDSEFKFGDLEILIRAARTDIGMEINIVRPEDFPKHLASLKEHFMNGQDLNWRENAVNKNHSSFALLLKAEDIPEWKDGEWHRRPNSECWIIWLKPNCFAGLPADISGYAEEFPDFPQQTTANQFFDEAQWESYRRLGFEMGSRLFKNREPFDPLLPLIRQK